MADYERSLVAAYDMSTIDPPNLAPFRAGQYDGTGVNIVAADVVDGIAGGQCLHLGGDDEHVNIGDVVELNAVSAFTIAFWMSQDVLDQLDTIFRKYLDGNNNICILTVDTDGTLRIEIENGGIARGIFDYSTVISANSWHHVAIVFDGIQTGNANRLVVCVDGNPVTLAFGGTIPAVTSDLSGQDATIGRATASFDGKLDGFRIYQQPLSQTQIMDLMVAQRQGRK